MNMAKAEKKPKATVADYSTVIRPLITEKSSVIGGDGSKVVFEVARTASKKDIRGAVERIFSVDVQSIRTINNLGKLKRRGNKTGRTAMYKKAYVKLLPGQTIDIVEGL
jgi:large subunit ribosomal protein L23